MLRLAEDDCADAEGAASRRLQSGLDFYLRLRRLQSGAHAKPDRRSSGGVSPGRRVSAGASELDSEGHKTPEIKPFDISNHEKQKEKHAANQFFSSLLGLLASSSLGFS